MSDIKMTLPCRVNKVVYSSGTFFVLQCELDEVSDCFPTEPGAVPYEWTDKGLTVQLSTEFETEIELYRTYVFSGVIHDHARFGSQFKSNYFFPDVPTSEKLMRQYLDCMPQVGPVRARMMVDRFGEARIPDIIENNHEMLIEIDGITEERALEISEKWMEDRTLRDTYIWMCKHDIPVDYASRVIKVVGKKDVISKIEDNPYILTAVKGIGFKMADTIAHRILENVPGDMRVLYCVQFILGEAKRDGHLCVPATTMSRVVEEQLAEFKPQEDFENIFGSVIASKFVLVRNEGRTFVYMPSVFRDEREVASNLVAMIANKSDYEATDDDIAYAENELASYMGEESITLDGLQADAVRGAFNSKVSVISGGGGTGKSTICRCIHTIAVKKGLDTLFLTPTGAAAKVLAEKTSTEAMTIHRALGMRPGSPPEPDHEIGANIVIIDEFSMVGIDTFPYLLDAILSPRVTNIVFVGDPQQLPSVSAGSFLSEIIGSGLADVIILDRIHRQSDSSYIPVVADEISKGMYSGIPHDAIDVTLIDAVDDHAAASTARKAVADYMDRNGTLDGLQVLSPMYKGPAGVDSLCEAIQEMVIGEGKEAMSYKNSRYYVGDRVMQMTNNYDKDVYNGNIGNVIEFGTKYVNPGDQRESKFIVVNYDGREVEYTESQIDEIRVCWCCTIHKYQGSQVEHVIMMACRSHFRMMSRELVYTGMTRASDRLQIIGLESMIDRANSVSIIKKRFSHTGEMMRRFHSGNSDGFDVRNRHLCDES